MPEAHPKYKLTTTLGEITVELDPEQAPIGAKNFAAYADAGKYDGTIFHRVIDGFMIQGGAFEPDMTQRRGDKPIKNEWKNDLNNERGALAWARLGGDPDSATNQFFINVNNNSFLDRAQPDGAGYAVFGRVVEGMDVVDAIKNVPTGRKSGHDDVPRDPVIIQKVEKIA